MPQRRDVRIGNQPTPSVRRRLLAARRVLIGWGQKNFAKYPWRNERNSFHALIAEILLQRTRADQVIVPFGRFRVVFPDSQSLAQASEASILRVIGSLGLHWRAKFLRRLGRELAKQGHIPSTQAELIALPGVGPYAAGAYLSFHAGRRGVLLDSNIVRLYGRLLGLPTGPETRRNKLFRDIASTITPAHDSKSYNYALLDFTRAICKPLPECATCPLVLFCSYGRNAMGMRESLSGGRHPRQGVGPPAELVAEPES